jgi:hypothetical protein
MNYVESTLDSFEKEASAILTGGAIGGLVGGEDRRREGAVMGAVGGKGLALATYPLHSEGYYQALLSDKGYQGYKPEKGPFKALRAQFNVLKDSQQGFSQANKDALHQLQRLEAQDPKLLKGLGKALLKQNLIKGGLGVAAGLGAGYLAKNYGWGDEMAAERREEELAEMALPQRMVERIKDNPGAAAAAGLGTAAALGGAAYYGLS